MGVHDGHRERLKDNFKKNGLNSFNDVNALELLLFYAIPRKDTNEVAHALLERFGSLSAVFQASVPELCDVKGIGESAALLITMLPQMVRRCSVLDTEKEITVINSSKTAGAYFVPRFAYEPNELALMVCLDSKKRVIGCYELGRGVINSVNFSIRKLTEIALSNKASSVILAHNHPDSDASPSTADTMMTDQIYKALRLVDITLDDHIIVAGDRYNSLRETGIL